MGSSLKEIGETRAIGETGKIKERKMGALAAGFGGMTWLIIPIVLIGAVVGFIYWGSASSGNVLSTGLSEPLDGAKTARVVVNSDTGHLTIDALATGEQALASGTLQYFEKQGTPTHTLSSIDGQANLTLSGGGTGLSGFRPPWAACGGAYEWQIHLNPAVSSDITAYSGGGNLKLDLAGMAVTRLSAETGGGNVDVVLPDDAANLGVLAKTGGGNVTVDVGDDTTGSNTVSANSGAGNVVVRVPSGIAARIHVTSGLGKTIVDPAFSQTDKNTYQSPDYDGAANRVEITASSGAGNVSVEVK